jgi:hypothetical protein
MWPAYVCQRQVHTWEAFKFPGQTRPSIVDKKSTTHSCVHTVPGIWRRNRKSLPPRESCPPRMQQTREVAGRSSALEPGRAGAGIHCKRVRISRYLLGGCPKDLARVLCPGKEFHMDLWGKYSIFKVSGEVPWGINGIDHDG